MPDLDETISGGQTGHITDHQLLADLYNKLVGSDAAAGTTLLRTLLDGAYVALSKVPVNALDYAAVGDDATDNTTPLTNALAAAKAGNRPLYVPAGVYRYAGNILNLNWHGATIYGDGQSKTTGGTILKQTDNAANGITVTPLTPAEVIYAVAVRDLKLEGPGLAVGTGVGLDLTPSGAAMAPKNGVHVENVQIRGWGSHGLATKNTDYLRLDRVQIGSVGGHGWYADSGTNASTATGCAFGTGSTTETYPVGKAAFCSEDSDATLFTGCEFGTSEYGVIVLNGGTQNLVFQACRSEMISVLHAVIGEATTPYPVNIRFSNCDFLGNAVLTRLIEVNGASGVMFDQCWTGNNPAGATFVKAIQDSNNSKVYMRQSQGGAADFLFENSTGATKINAEEITYDGTYDQRYLSVFNVYGGQRNWVSSSAAANYASRTEGDTQDRWYVRGTGRMDWGSGAAASDTAIERESAGLLRMAAGHSFKVDGTWNGGMLRLGNYRLWVDATGDLRINNGVPGSDLAGTVVGTQT